MRFCRNCGKELGEEDVICPQCGSGQDDAPIRPRPRDRTPYYVIAAVLVLVAAVLIVPIFFQEQISEQHSYKMTFTVDWYAVVDASGTVDNGYDSDAEVYFQITYNGKTEYLLVDTNDPLEYYSTHSVTVYTDVSTAMEKRTEPTEYNTTVFYVSGGRTAVSITVFMRDYDGGAKFGESSDDILDIYDANSDYGSSGSQGIIINVPVGKDKTGQSGGDMDPRGFFGYTVSFERI